MNSSDELLFEVLEQVRQQGLSLPDPRSIKPTKDMPPRTRSKRPRASSKDVVCGYQVVVSDAAAEGPGLPELRGHAVIVGPDLMGLSLEVVAGWCATHLAGMRGGTKSAMAAARKLRKLSILAVVDHCQPTPTSFPQASQPSTSSRAGSSILGG